MTFEATAEPLIRQMLEGVPMALAPRDQVALAGWFVKTDILLVMWRIVMNSNVDPAIPSETVRSRYEILRRTLLAMLDTDGLPPANCLVRLAYISLSINDPAQHFSRPGLKSFTPLDLGASINVLPSSVLSESFVMRGVQRVQIPKEPERFVQVFPPHDCDVAWPPPITLGPRDVDALRQAWGHPQQSIVGNFPETRLRKIQSPVDPDDSEPSG